MDSIIPLGQKNTLAEYMILSGADNRLPMLDILGKLHAYLEQHKLHANEVHLLRERNQDPLAFVANQQMTPPYYNTYQSS
ncbi:hypothetical protein Tco_0865052 [Tanacetum coccineum]